MNLEDKYEIETLEAPEGEDSLYWFKEFEKDLEEIKKEGYKLAHQEILEKIDELYQEKIKEIPKELKCICGKCDLVKFSKKEIIELLSQEKEK